MMLALCTVHITPVASAQPDTELAGAVVSPPDGPAQAWLVADLDTGAVLG